MSNLLNNIACNNLPKIYCDNLSFCTNPVVSILMITYNHEKYIAEAIEGMLSQKTTFNFELIIGEDRSTDSTLAIAISYQKKFPSIIKIVTSSNNVGFGLNFKRIVQEARAKYIATCEGDDYWIDEDKLRDQVDLMESDEKLALVHTDHAIRQDFWGSKFITSPRGRYADLQDKSHLFGNIQAEIVDGLVTHTSTVLVKAIILKSFVDDSISDAPGAFYDRSLNSWYTLHGNAGYIDRPSTVYRVWGGSFMRANSVSYYKMGLDLYLFNEEFFKRYPDFAALYPDTIKRELSLLLMAAMKMGDICKIGWVNDKFKEYSFTHEIPRWKIFFLNNYFFAFGLRNFFFIRKIGRELSRKTSIYFGFIERLKLDD